SLSFPHQPTTIIITLTLHDALPILPGETQQAEPVAKGDEDYPLHTDLPRTSTLESRSERLLRAFFFDIMLPSRLVTSLVFAGLKDRKSTRLNSSHVAISYAVFCLKE